MSRVWSSYKLSFHAALSNYKTILLLYTANLMATLVVLYPLKSMLTNLLSKRDASKVLSEVFDLNIIMDILHAHGPLAHIFIMLLLVILFCYFLWLNFVAGGILGLANNRTRQISEFFKYGAHYFFKNLRLSLYVLILYLGFIFLAYIYFAKDGFNVLKMEDELVMMNRFYICSTLLLIVFFCIAVFRDLARVHMVGDASNFIFSRNRNALKRSFHLQPILLGIINVLVLVPVVMLHFYFTQHNIYEFSSIIALLAGQLLIFIRIFLKFVRLTSFYHLENYNNSLSS